MRIKSHFPPFCFESPVTGKKWIVCTGKGTQWIEVDRWFGWTELEPLWDKIEYGHTNEVTKTSKKEYKVKGSKKNVYKVVSDDGIWTCSCPAHGFGRGKDCKHIIQIKSKKK